MRNLTFGLIVLGCVLMSSWAVADVALFKGQPVSVAGITIGGWGSGSAVEASERVYEGTRSVKVTTQGLYQGGRIDYRNPVEIIEPDVDETSYVHIALVFPSLIRQGSPTFVTPGFGAKSVPDEPTPVASVSPYYYEEEIPTRPKSNLLRIVLESADGKAVDAMAPVPFDPDDDGWYKISIPFKALGLLGQSSFKVSRVLIFSDVPDTFYVGLITTVKDTSPIVVQPGDEQVVAVGDTVTFQAEAYGGGTPLRYSWNFAERSGDDGEDAVGRIVSHVFKKGGDYNVKLTVYDIWGIKKPATAIHRVIVND